MSYCDAREGGHEGEGPDAGDQGLSHGDPSIQDVLQDADVPHLVCLLEIGR